jgi:SAM-dependent methyltransferase
MEDVTESERLREKRERLALMVKYLRGGLVCEMGSGSGFVLEFLSESLPGSTLIGLDRSIKSLDALRAKQNPDMLAVAADLRLRVLDGGRCDSVIFVWSMHEVFSRYGDTGVSLALKTAADLIKADGVIVIQDFLKPEPKQAVLGFRNADTGSKFERFARDFQQRKVHFHALDGAVRLDVADAVEFLSKYRIVDEEEWAEETAEAHFFYTFEDHMLRVDEAGLDLVTSERLPLGVQAMEAARTDMDFDFRPYSAWIQLILRKA